MFMSGPAHFVLPTFTCSVQMLLSVVSGHHGAADRFQWGRTFSFKAMSNQRVTPV